MGDQRPDAGESFTAFVLRSHAVRGPEPRSSRAPSFSLLSVLWRRGSQVAHFPAFTLLIKAPESPKQQKSHSSIPLSLCLSRSSFLALSPAFFSNTPVVFFFSSSLGMNCKLVKNAVLIPKPFLVRSPSFAPALSLFSPKLRNLALLKT